MAEFFNYCVHLPGRHLCDNVLRGNAIRANVFRANLSASKFFRGKCHRIAAGVYSESLETGDAHDLGSHATVISIGSLLNTHVLQTEP
jgi:hypothetical protein